MDKRLALMAGIDIPLPECGLVIHQPKIREIAYVGEKDFWTGLQTFCLNKRMFAQDKDVLENTNNFQIFMTIMKEKETADKKFAVQQIFPLFFPTQKVMITPRALAITGEGQQPITIDENNFEILQEVIVEICCLRSGMNDQSTFNPADDKAREIAQKIMRGRQIVAEQKGETNVSVFSQYVSALTIGLNSMSLDDILDLTIYQLYDLVERYSLYMNWDIDIKSRLAGAKPDQKPDNWMKNIH